MAVPIYPTSRKQKEMSAGEDRGATEEGDTGSRDGCRKLFRQEHYYPGSWGSTISQNRWAASTETAGACERVRGGVRDVGVSVCDPR